MKTTNETKIAEGSLVKMNDAYLATLSATDRATERRRRPYTPVSVDSTGCAHLLDARNRHVVTGLCWLRSAR